MAYFNGLTDAQRVAPENMFIYRLYTITALDSTANYLIENRSLPRNVFRTWYLLTVQLNGSLQRIWTELQKL